MSNFFKIEVIEFMVDFMVVFLKKILFTTTVFYAVKVFINRVKLPSVSLKNEVSNEIKELSFEKLNHIDFRLFKGIVENNVPKIKDAIIKGANVTNAKVFSKSLLTVYPNPGKDKQGYETPTTLAVLLGHSESLACIMENSVSDLNEKSISLQPKNTSVEYSIEHSSLMSGFERCAISAVRKKGSTGNEAYLKMFNFLSENIPNFLNQFSSHTKVWGITESNSFGDRGDKSLHEENKEQVDALIKKATIQRATGIFNQLNNAATISKDCNRIILGYTAGEMSTPLQKYYKPK